jgi:hypothetical protein
MFLQVQKASRTLNRHDQHRTSPQHIIAKTISTENKEKMLKVVRKKKQITYNGKPIKITADFTIETSHERRAWSEVF